MIISVWITGQVIDQENDKWLFGGVYSTKERAIENCFNDDWFVAEVQIDEASVIERTQYEKAWYPTCEEEPKN